MTVPGVPGVYMTGCFDNYYNNVYRREVCVDIDVMSPLAADGGPLVALGQIPLSDTVLLKDHVLSGSEPQLAVRIEEQESWSEVCKANPYSGADDSRISDAWMKPIGKRTCEETHRHFMGNGDENRYLNYNATQRAGLTCAGDCTTLFNTTTEDQEYDGQRSYRMMRQAEMLPILEAYYASSSSDSEPSVAPRVSAASAAAVTTLLLALFTLA